MQWQIKLTYMAERSTPQHTGLPHSMLGKKMLQHCMQCRQHRAATLHAMTDSTWPLQLLTFIDNRASKDFE